MPFTRITLKKSPLVFVQYVEFKFQKRQNLIAIFVKINIILKKGEKTP